MSFNKKNLLGLLAGVVGLAAIKSATGSKSLMTMHYMYAQQCLDDANGNARRAKQICEQRYADEIAKHPKFKKVVFDAIDELAARGSKSLMTMHYMYAEDCLNQANGNAHRAKQICRQKYGELNEKGMRLVLDAIDELAARGSMAKIPKGKDGFSREQDLAFFRYKMNTPKFAGAAPDFDERNAEVSRFQSEMQSAKANIKDLQEAINAQDKAALQAELAELDNDLAQANANLSSLQEDLANTRKSREQLGEDAEWYSGKAGVKAQRTRLEGLIAELRTSLGEIQEKIDAFDLIRMSAARTQEQKEAARNELDKVQTKIGILNTGIDALKAQMKSQQQAYDARLGTDMTFEQYAEANYQRPWGEMSDRYGDDGPAARAWKQFTEKMSPYSQSQKTWSPEASASPWASAFGSAEDMKDYADGDASWDGSSSGSAWDDATDGFSGKLPDLPKFRS